jgi:hypothetical protein
MVLTSDRYSRWTKNRPMSEIPMHEKPGRCAVCDTYNLKGLWTCECGALNVSVNKQCWKCQRERDGPSVPDGGQDTGIGQL